jgi:hypothetical protein
MNFAKIIDAVPVVVATVAVLSIPFFVYKFLQEDRQCQQAAGCWSSQQADGRVSKRRHDDTSKEANWN